MPGMDADHLAIVAALRKIPADQRMAIVLHRLVVKGPPDLFAVVGHGKVPQDGTAHGGLAS